MNILKIIVIIIYNTDKNLFEKYELKKHRKKGKEDDEDEDKEKNNAINEIKFIKFSYFNNLIISFLLKIIYFSIINISIKLTT